MSISTDITDLAQRWREIKVSPAAMASGDYDGLQGLTRDQLLQLTYDALKCLEALEPYAYALSAFEAHLEGPGHHYEGWCVAQADGTGGFNKWSKVLGGYSDESGPSGDFLLCEDWKHAMAILDSKPKDIRAYFRVYPVVMSAGYEPRTTEPPKDR